MPDLPPHPPRPRWRARATWAALVSFVALVALTVGIHRVGRVTRLDVHALDVVDDLRRHAAVVVLQSVTWLGDFLFASVFLLAVSGLVARHRRSWAPFWLGVSAVAVLLATVGTGKQVIARSRIPFAVNQFGDGGTSYPSGHTTTAVVVGGTLVLLAAPALSRRGLRTAWAAMALYAGLIGVSRLYLRMHWLTDVLAGWLLGTTIVCLLALLSVRPAASRPEPSPSASSPSTSGPGAPTAPPPASS